MTVKLLSKLFVLLFILMSCKHTNESEVKNIFSNNLQEETTADDRRIFNSDKYIDEGNIPLYFDDTYQSRYAKIRYLANRFQIGSFSTGDLGVWAGIMHQSKWQVKSKRDQIPIWRYINATLTIEPYQYATQLLLQNGNCSKAKAIMKVRPEISILKLEDCKKWQDFFQYIIDEQGNYSIKVAQKMLWHAHSSSISTALKQFRSTFDYSNLQIPYKEYHYWKGWVNLVYHLEKLNFSTTNLATSFISNSLLASCSPIGATNCQLEDLSFGQRKLAEMLISNTFDNLFDVLENK